jgi:hypothetical protein
MSAAVRPNFGGLFSAAWYLFRHAPAAPAPNIHFIERTLAGILPHLTCRKFLWLPAENCGLAIDVRQPLRVLPSSQHAVFARLCQLSLPEAMNGRLIALRGCLAGQRKRLQIMVQEIVEAKHRQLIQGGCGRKGAVSPVTGILCSLSRKGIA